MLLVLLLWASPLYTLTLTVINEGESTEYVTVAFIEQDTDEEGHQGVRVFGDEGHEGSEPHELRPRGVLRAPTDLDDEQLAFLRDGFVGIVWLGSGQEVRSDVEYLNEESSSSSSAGRPTAADAASCGADCPWRRGSSPGVICTSTSTWDVVAALGAALGGLGAAVGAIAAWRAAVASERTSREARDALVGSSRRADGSSGTSAVERYLEPNTRCKSAVSPAVWNLTSLPSR
jgi:hypothetical protein